MIFYKSEKSLILINQYKKKDAADRMICYIKIHALPMHLYKYLVFSF